MNGRRVTISLALTLAAGTVLAFSNGSKAPVAAAIWLMLAQRNGRAEGSREKEC